jgi:hypothetical protein
MQVVRSVKTSEHSHGVTTQKTVVFNKEAVFVDHEGTVVEERE